MSRESRFEDSGNGLGTSWLCTCMERLLGRCSAIANGPKSSYPPLSPQNQRGLSSDVDPRLMARAKIGYYKWIGKVDLSSYSRTPNSFWTIGFGVLFSFNYREERQMFIRGRKKGDTKGLISRVFLPSDERSGWS